MSRDNSRHRKPLKLKTGAFDRNVAMARMGMVAGSQFAGHTVGKFLRGHSRSKDSEREFYVKQAEYIADELGRLKGSVMKVGQMLSVYGQYFMPPEVTAVLRSLQDDSPAVDWAELEPVLNARLGREQRNELEIDPEPLAAASLGQVHRGRRKSDGRELCIKIQYPHLADAIDSDIRTLSRIIRMAHIVPRGVDLTAIMEEVREMIYHEVDYDRELRLTREFGERLAGDERFVVPEVFPQYSGDSVLVTSYEQASHVESAAVQDLSQPRRNRLAENALHLLFTEFFRWGMVQTDPHFGNYKIRVDAQGQDQLVLLDFGATRDFGPHFLNAYRDIVAGAFERNPQQLVEGAIGINLFRRDLPQSVFEEFAAVGMLMIEPFAEQPPTELLTSDGAYRWGASDLPTRLSRAVSKAAISRWFRIPPRELVFLHRRMGGVFVLLAVLDAELDARELLADYLYATPSA